MCRVCEARVAAQAWAEAAAEAAHIEALERRWQQIGVAFVARAGTSALVVAGDRLAPRGVATARVLHAIYCIAAPKPGQQQRGLQPRK